MKVARNANDARQSLLVSVVVNVIVVTFPERLICKVMAEHVSERLGSSERVEGI